jgi:hypothetical protein
MPQGPTEDRRIARLPLILASVGVVLAIGFAVLVASLALGTQSTPTAAPATSASAPSPQASTPPPVARPVAGPNECVDALGDGDPVDLDLVRLERSDDRFVATFRLVETVPADGAASVGIYAASVNGRHAYQIAAKFSAGHLVEFFSYDFEREDYTNLDRDGVSVDGTTIVAEFDRDAIKRIGRDWEWYAFSTAQNTVIDACPGDVGSFDSLRFEDSDGN